MKIEGACHPVVSVCPFKEFCLMNSDFVFMIVSYHKTKDPPTYSTIQAVMIPKLFHLQSFNQI